MSWLYQFIFSLALLAGIPALAQNPPLPGAESSSPSSASLLPPPLPPARSSPVVFFRQLLALSPLERTALLTNRTPEARATILAKVREYQALAPDECELRLRATELRWYLTPLLRLAATNREARLDTVPDHLRELVEARLVRWDILPPPLQQEFLANDRALHYFAHLETTNSTPVSPEQARIAGQFNQFFELTPAERRQTLTTLSPAERTQMEATLQAFAQLPPQQRFTCVRNYAKFAGMTPAARSEFLKNAESWTKMSPAERRLWRDLVQNVPIWPPMPPPVIPRNLMPHSAPKIPRANVATNLN